MQILRPIAQMDGRKFALDGKPKKAFRLGLISVEGDKLAIGILNHKKITAKRADLESVERVLCLRKRSLTDKIGAQSFRECGGF